jgi:hypothetical protein
VKLVYIHLNPGKEIGDVCDEWFGYCSVELEATKCGRVKGGMGGKKTIQHAQKPRQDQAYIIMLDF